MSDSSEAISQLWSWIEYIIKSLKYILAIILPLFVVWILRVIYDKRKRGKEISDLARGLKAEILGIRNEAIKREDNEYVVMEKYRVDYSRYLYTKVKGHSETDLLEKYKYFQLSDVPENLDNIYNANVHKLGMLEEELIYKVKRHYVRFRSWKEKHQKLKSAFSYIGLGGAYTLEEIELLEECERFVKSIIKIGDELEKELDKKIKS